jgi:molybdenum cofactor cytidylyltransferase
MPSVAIVPAAGKGERFGGAKLVALIEDKVLIDLTIRSLLDGGVDCVIVVMAPGASLSESKLLEDRRVQTVVNEDPSRGMFSSIQTGLAVADGDPVVILPADMPFVQSRTVAAVLEACVRQGRFMVPIHDGRRGHPVAFPASLREAVLRASPNSTLKEALASARVDRVEWPVDDPGVLRDVDTREDLSR